MNAKALKLHETGVPSFGANFSFQKLKRFGLNYLRTTDISKVCEWRKKNRQSLLTFHLDTSILRFFPYLQKAKKIVKVA